jgi:hypothetical protein
VRVRGTAVAIETRMDTAATDSMVTLSPKLQSLLGDLQLVDGIFSLPRERFEAWTLILSKRSPAERTEISAQLIAAAATLNQDGGSAAELLCVQLISLAAALVTQDILRKLQEQAGLDLARRSNLTGSTETRRIQDRAEPAPDGAVPNKPWVRFTIEPGRKQ